MRTPVLSPGPRAEGSIPRAALHVVRGVVLALGLVACGAEPPPPPPAPPGIEVEVIGSNRFAIGAGWWGAAATDEAILGGVADAVLMAGAPEEEAPGVLVGPLGPGARAARIGLRSGDRLRAIRGHRPATPADAAALLRGLHEAPMFTIEVLRQGQPVTLIYEVR